MWEKCIEASRGCLVLEKSWWNLVDFTWNEGKWEYTSDMDDVGLYIKDVAGVNRKLVQLDSREAHNIIGVWLATDGNNTHQVQEMRKQSEEWATKVRTNAIDRYDAWNALNLAILKKLEHPLVTLTLSEVECDSIMVPV